MPLHENNVLRFSVLPNTFTLMDKDGSNESKETKDPVPDKPTLAEEKDKSSNKTIMVTATWYPNPEKKFGPLRSPPIPKTSSVFREFQKKYMEKKQPSMDE
ncbi:protein AMN1 homolog [Symphorus nematophorus]